MISRRTHTVHTIQFRSEASGSAGDDGRASCAITIAGHCAECITGTVFYLIATITQQDWSYYYLCFPLEEVEREVNYFPQDHTARKNESWNLNPVLLDLRPHTLHCSVLPLEWHVQVL